MKKADKTQTINNDLDGVPGLLSPTEAAKVLHVSRKTIDRWIYSGRLHSARLTPAGSGKRLIRRSEIERFLAECEDRP